MNQQIDLLPYKKFKELKQKYTVKTVLIKNDDIGGRSLALLYKDHRQYVASLFKDIGVEVLRWSHDYDSLTTSEPRLGVVYLANDSVIVPGIEAHVLINHNARYVQGE